MTTDDICADLVDIEGVALMMAMKPDSARTLIGRSVKSSHPFPSPCVRLGGRPGWQREDVLDWIDGRPGAGRGPRPSRRLSDHDRLYSIAKGRDYLSISQCARWMRLDLEEFRRLPRSRRPKETKVGTSWIRFMVCDVEAFIEANRKKAA